MADGRLPLVFIGPMGAGKTRIGRRVARELSVPFIDTDARVVADHGPITAIFETHGEEHFRSLEREAVADALRERAVVSLGGGAVLDPRTRERLSRHAVVFLDVTADAVLARMKTSTRPLLRDGPDAWQRIYDERRALYDALATVVFDTSRRPITRIAAEIADWARGIPDPEEDTP